MSDELTELLNEESQLSFPSFNNKTAWKLGSLIRAKAIERDASIAIEIKVNDCVLFYTSLPGTTIDNEDWIQRKSNLVHKYGHSSWFIKRKYELRNQDFFESTQLSVQEYAPYGGSYPLYIADILIGSVTVSGLPQVEDHKLVIECIREML